MIHNLILGKLGEEMAADFLKSKGYKIIEQNCQNKWGEIDLVCLKENQVIFVEVKTRIGEQFGLPEDAINKNKLQRLVNNAAVYMKYKAGNYDEYRIDAMCIVLDEQHKLKRINHYENITA